MKILKFIFVGFCIFFATVLLLFAFGVMWKSPPNHSVETYRELKAPVMNMTDYEEIMGTHRRPYTYSIQSENGAQVSVVGVEHLNDPSHPQFDTIRRIWEQTKPDIALVEGRMGFLFTWFQNPIVEYGESGLSASLAKKNNVLLDSWEPSRQDEVNLLLKKYTANQLAMFYCLRPFWGSSFNDAEARIKDLINSRTDYEGLENTFKTSADLDQEWKKYYPDMDWRTYQNDRGLMPDGIIADMWNSSNLARDEHMIQIILEFLEKGNNIFVTMGSSHAPRIEQTLRTTIR